MAENIYSIDLFPEFRDADEDGLIGLRGYMNLFQDHAAKYLYSKGLGSNRLRREFKKAWLYTKYRFHINQKSDFLDTPLRIETWVENTKSMVVLNQDFKVSRDKEVLAFGRLEMCLLDINKGKLCKLNEVPVPDNIYSENAIDIPGFERFKDKDTEWKFAYDYTVRYSSLDITRHMNNLYYISAMLDIFDSNFYIENEIEDFEIHYLRQSYESNTIKFFYAEKDNYIDIKGVNGDEVAVRGRLGVKPHTQR